MDHSALTTARQLLTLLGVDQPEPRPLNEIVDLYLADLSTRATPTHCANVQARVR